MSRIQEGTEIVCPLCEEETTIVERNKHQKPYFTCRTHMAPVNLNSPISEAEEFLREFIDQDENDEEDEEGEINTVEDLFESHEESSE